MSEERSNDSKNRYKQCVYYDKNKCGESKRRKVDGIFKVTELNENCKEHLKHLKLLENIEQELEEKTLIENRTGKELNKSDYICAYHRYFLGVYYKPLKKCIHPNHVNISNKKTSSNRTATLTQINHLTNKFPDTKFIIGGQLCMTHIKQLNIDIQVLNQEDRENVALNDSTASEYEVLTHETVSVDEIDQSNQINEALSEVLSISHN